MGGAERGTAASRGGRVGRGARAVLGGALALAGLLALGALSRAPYTSVPEDAAELRLAWRARVPLLEECRRLTEAEQAELPVHMRRDEVCEGRVASYRLEVTVDGAPVLAADLSGAGARGDRPLYVFERLPLTPGQHEIAVRFVRIGAEDGPEDMAEGTAGSDPGAGTVDSGEAAGPTGSRGREWVPDRMVLVRTVDVGSRDVVMVTYDPAARALILD